MNFKNEGELEGWVRGLIDAQVTASDPTIYALKNKKAVDIVVCRDGLVPALFFIEVKYHQVAHGRLGFGTGKGAGFQPEIVSRKPKYFEEHMRWVIGTEHWHDNKVLFLPSSVVRKYVSGGSVRDVFNNIQAKIFKEIEPLSETAFVSELKRWLGAAPNQAL
jgi:hypothetical protein